MTNTFHSLQKPMQRYRFFISTYFFLFLSFTSFAQQIEVDSMYAMVYTVGKNWNNEIPVHDQSYFTAHSRHLALLRKTDKIVMGGRYDDKGFMLLKAKNIEEAEAIVQRDSSVIFQTFNVALYPFDIFYSGYVVNNKNTLEKKEPKVKGLGGFFFRSKNPEELRNWYREHLGIEGGDEGTSFEWRKVDDPTSSGFTVWHAFSKTDDYFDVAGQEFMINYRVQNLEGLLEDLRKKGVEIVGETKTYDYGSFAWILDLEGRKVELWQPNDSIYDEITEQRMKSN